MRVPSSALAALLLAFFSSASCASGGAFVVVPSASHEAAFGVIRPAVSAFRRPPSSVVRPLRMAAGDGVSGEGGAASYDDDEEEEAPEDDIIGEGVGDDCAAAAGKDSEEAEAAGSAASSAPAASSSPKSAIDDFRRVARRTTSDRRDKIDVTMKFGGSSIANVDRIDHVTQLIKSQIDAGYRPRAVICSAMGKTTNGLLAAGDFALEGKVSIDAIRTLHQACISEFDLPEHVRDQVNDLLDECQDLLKGVSLLQELSPKSLDQLVSYGERCSVRIVAARLNQIGVPAQAVDAWDVGIRTDSNFGDAHLLPDCADTIKEAFSSRIDPNVVAVVTGFIGHDPEGRITTLGRGGSDLTATAIGAALDLDEVQVWKDVDGILTADPRLVNNAVPVSDVSYEEAAELAYFGAQVLHPIAMQPAMKKEIPVRVKNSYNPSSEGTIISKRETSSERLVTAITCKRNVQLLDIHSTQMLGAYGFLATVFNDLEKHRLSVDVLASSEVSVSLTLDKKQKAEDINAALEELRPYADATLHCDRAILTLIADVERTSEVLATVFRVFNTRDIKVEMMSQGASKVNISFVLRNDQIDDAILNLHYCFFEDRCVVQMTPGEESAQDVNGSPLIVAAP